MVCLRSGYGCKVIYSGCDVVTLCLCSEAYHCKHLVTFGFRLGCVLLRLVTVGLRSGCILVTFCLRLATAGHGWVTLWVCPGCVLVMLRLLFRCLGRILVTFGYVLVALGQGWLHYGWVLLCLGYVRSRLVTFW